MKALSAFNSALRTNVKARDDRYLRSDGSNLAAYLKWLSESSDEGEQKAWMRINLYVSRVAPSIKKLLPTLVGADSIRLDWEDEHDERFGGHQLSDGTLRAIALITALAQPVSMLPKVMPSFLKKA
jgi:predicted ATPase